MQAPIRWGIIGCGDVTEVKSGPAYQLTAGFELVAVMRRSAELAADYAKRHNVAQHFDDADALISSPDVDAVYIATPPDSHLEYALKVAEAGKPCCIEKPMAPSVTECETILNAFETQNLPLFIAYYRRSLPRFLQVKDWLDEGKIGQVRHIDWHCHKPPSPIDLSNTPNWRTDASIAPAGYFDDLACHGLDLLHFFFGDFAQVNGYSTNQQNLYSAKDAVVASWIHKNGITGTGSWHFGSAESVDKVTIYGAAGTIEYAVFDDAPVMLKTAAKQQEVSIPHPKHVQQPHVQAIANQLLEGKPHPSTGVNGVHTAWVMDKILGNR